MGREPFQLDRDIFARAGELMVALQSPRRLKVAKAAHRIAGLTIQVGIPVTGGKTRAHRTKA